MLPYTGPSRTTGALKDGKWKMSYLCPNLNGIDKDTAPWRPELGESWGPGVVHGPNMHWACSGMHN